MAIIKFADGTMTTREVHEHDTQVVVPEGAVPVDHGPVVTSGLPDDLIKAPLGMDFVVPERAVEPAVVEPTPEPEKPKPAPRRAAPRADVKPPEKPPEPARSTPAFQAAVAPQARPASKPEPKEQVPDHHHAVQGSTLKPEMDTSGSVPQGRIGLDAPHAPGRDQERREHSDNLDD